MKSKSHLVYFKKNFYKHLQHRHFISSFKETHIKEISKHL